MGAGCDPGTIGDLVDELADKAGFVLLKEVRGRPQLTTWYHGDFIILSQGYNDDDDEDEGDTWWTVTAIHSSIRGKITHMQTGARWQSVRLRARSGSTARLTATHLPPCSARRVSKTTGRIGSSSGHGRRR